jgi:Xaa-Pro aminopeptidase
MSRRYSSFLLRCWSWEDQRQRIEIEHVQSGAQIKLDSMDAAFDWMEARLTERAVTEKQVDVEIETIARKARVPNSTEGADLE